MMAENIKIGRVEKRLRDCVCNKIDCSDLADSREREPHILSRAIAALAITMKSGVDVDVASRTITDGFNDLGIDAVYLDSVQHKLLIVQSKWREGTGGITQVEIMKFVEGVKRIIRQDINGANEKLLAKVADIDTALNDMSYQVEMIYCHTGNVRASDFVLRPVRELLVQVNEGGGTADILVFSEIILNDIYDYLASGRGDGEINIHDFALNNWGVIDSPHKVYYGFVSASVLGDWFGKFGSRLFAKNIRYYKGSTDVNSGMRDVLCNDPDSFIYYNNGVKLLCRKITKKILGGVDNKLGMFALEGVSLVNGAQTTGAIGVTFEKDPEQVARAKVFIQMIELGDASEDTATQITRLTNTQNRIEGKDFASLDPEQERLRRDLSFSSIEYLYKTGAIIEDATRQISFDDALIGQACASSDLSVVALAKRNVGALTEDIQKAPYRLLFNHSTNACEVLNNVRVYQLVEMFLSENAKRVQGLDKGVLLHGNRLIVHLVIGGMRKEFADYVRVALSPDDIKDKVFSLCQQYCQKMMETLSRKSDVIYLGHIFTSVSRLRELLADMEIIEPTKEAELLVGSSCRQETFDFSD